MGQSISTAIRCGKFRFGCILTLATGLSSVATAGLIGDHSWTRESKDGRHLLVMLYRGPRQFDVVDQDTIELNSKYKQSGVYIRDHDKEALFWQLPYQSSAYRVYFSPDGEHLLMAVNAGHSFSDVPLWGALHFFHRNGESQHWMEYDFTWGFIVKETLHIYALRSFSEWTDTEYDQVAGTIAVRTNRTEEFMFDVATGQKIHTRSAWDRWTMILLFVIPIVIFLSRQIARRTPSEINKATRWRLSVAEALLLVTVVAMLLAVARFSFVVAVAVLLLGLGGGAVAQLVARGRRAWWLGGIAAVYGSFVGLVFFSLLVEPILWRIPHVRGDYFLLAIFALFLLGGVIGALVGGLLAKESRQVGTS